MVPDTETDTAAPIADTPRRSLPQVMRLALTALLVVIIVLLAVETFQMLVPGSDLEGRLR